MKKYLISRVFSMLVTIILITALTFAMMHSIPGGPFTREKAIPDEILRQLNAKYNLDDPLIIQYLDYMKRLIRFDLGPSFSKVGVSVNDIIVAGMPASARIGLLASIVIIVLGIPLGIISALKQNKPIDYLVMFMATLGITIPSFVVATLIIYFFAGKLGWLPSYGLATPLGYVGPVIALSGFSLSFVSRLTRSSMLEVMRQDYIRTARANGIRELSVIGWHAMKNALIPVVTYLGPMIAAILTGSFVVERIFAIPGIGRYFVDSVSNRDYTTIMGVTVFYAVFYMIMVLLVDIAYVLIDPRIKFGSEN
ncbi:MAG: peptide ABC transporter permease [Spirochaetes bacterium GWD1_61_31]|nr:MAG: peptide ABC transporter permease [Spirochaetes bacterium GWB1_60_80]OHD28490.1 MAG: peptide ABC transporter permease [Spirochaetes bacterium GWC1_61_12]OHD40107.1 MAG: peptide ABC transporter permease [Spirochaetes bacterium GWD1_61_31]OHD45845.1 MAG: peptide ABC transporter permease [Spirochaetes bacterium GWE1_60_18]OHD58388.1 MAG: peptide ABC transporter permease [Spirochaetes bacterium GWF1_60_12]HAW85366.1 peptide ABC transporter permease [Spirochaetaceae bacterium]